MGKENIVEPIILREGNYTPKDLAYLRQEQAIWKETEIYESQLAELYEVLHPDLKRESDFVKQQRGFVETRKKAGGSWVYFPWSGHLLHIVPEADLIQLTTNRNKNLITEKEQEVLKKAVVGVLGMSVGNGIAVALGYSGIAHTLKLADFDTVETCNLNRLRAGVQDIGTPKIVVASRQLYEANPYLKIEQFPKGIGAEDLDNFFGGGHPLTVVFDEIDDFVMKVRLRHHAKQAHVPVLMLTNLGDSILIDIERYDLDPDLPLFNGLLGDIPDQILQEETIGEKEKVKYAMRLVGIEHIPTRALASLFDINHTLVGRPQLYSTVAIGGGLAAYLVRKLLLGDKVLSGRMHLSFDTSLGINSAVDEAQRRAILEKLEQMIGPA